MPAAVEYESDENKNIILIHLNQIYHEKSSIRYVAGCPCDSRVQQRGCHY